MVHVGPGLGIGTKVALGALVEQQIEKEKTSDFITFPPSFSGFQPLPSRFDLGPTLDMGRCPGDP